ncbi:glycosyltransferase [Vibrio splendidus]|uniref:glycosyltransferase n=1 Tax=Vibrio splendidus TaxID=29497 RepID=UPI000D33D158|nr:glycosyltransferase [Vibrio splendidus]MCC4882884.1 glycosyltransferase [Vibrio splendidus]PTO57621.1 hypothetical protein CWN96_22780 [Vibrio splendidus]
MNAKVSIVITTYNRKKLLVRALESVLNQTYRNIEVIITDDNSTDGTKEIVEKYMQSSAIPIIFRSNTKNMGACFTRNEGIKLATGHFYTGLDDDDEFCRNRIGNFVDNWHDSYSFLSSNINVVDKSKCYKLYFGSKVLTENNLYWYNFVGNQIFTLRKRVLDVSGFDVNLKSAQDLDLWIRLLRKFGPGYRLKEGTYNLYIDHDLPRITTSNSKIEGLNYFYEKHKKYMNRNQKDMYLLKISYWNNNLKAKASFIKFVSFESVYYLFSIVIMKLYRYVN